MNKPNNSPSAVANVRRSPPVRVKVFGADGKIVKVHPPDGEHKGWWLRLNKALGTTSSDFVNASLFQIQSACRSPWGGISQLAMNAALAMIEAAAPKDEIEAALAVQMACAHTAAMAVLAKMDAVLRRLRHGSQQVVPVEHVQINDGGQAVIGNLKK
jgi:hypothetical protein